MGGSLVGASEFFMILLLSISTIISPISNIKAEGAKGKKRQIEKEREDREREANKTARVKWERGKREANGK